MYERHVKYWQCLGLYTIDFQSSHLDAYNGLYIKRAYVEKEPIEKERIEKSELKRACVEKERMLKVYIFL